MDSAARTPAQTDLARFWVATAPQVWNPAVRQAAAARGLTMVPPFDHPWIIAGQGTCGLEVIEQSPSLSAVYVPMGGGGLISGTAVAVKSLRPGARIVGVNGLEFHCSRGPVGTTSV